MRRRLALRAGGAAALVMLLGGHTPYGQWTVYRRKHLLIGCHREDGETYALAGRIAAQLGSHLPEARARVARAPGPGRLASLLGTGQLDLAVLAPAGAQAIRAGRGPFAAYGPVPLALLLPLGAHLLAAHADFPARHAWLVADALLGTPLAPEAPRPENPALPWHPGSLARLEGRLAPDGAAGQ